MKKFDDQYRNKGFKYIIGCDEAGRGPWAGPLVAAAVMLPNDYENDLINDSKKLKESLRKDLFNEIIKVAIEYEIVVKDAEYVDIHNPKKSSRDAMTEAANKIMKDNTFTLIDAEKLEIENSEGIIKGDAKSLSIAAASILAKYTRDKLMIEIDKELPEYSFKDHKGYGTKKHSEALNKYGVTKYHRKSYKPVRLILDKKNDID